MESALGKTSQLFKANRRVNYKEKVKGVLIRDLNG